jgi:hypothetical protein
MARKRKYMYQPTGHTQVGEIFENGRPDWGRGRFMVMQVLSDGSRVLYRMNHGRRDERERWYVTGGPGARGIRRMSDG